ncbi:putative protein kinase RLK-Pelle-LRR-I-1 family [Helianthus debilis subsp. tardiflorus]
MIDIACGTYGYIDPLYLKGGFLSRESDIYSLGVVLLEMMCGRIQDPHKNLVDMVKQYHKEGKVDDLVFEGIKNQIVPKSLIAFVNMACECLHDEREKRPTASKVVLQLKEALKFQVSFHLLYTNIHPLVFFPNKVTRIFKKDVVNQETVYKLRKKY